MENLSGGENLAGASEDEGQRAMIQQAFARARTSPHDLWFERKDGKILNAFVNGDRAWLMYRRDDADAGKKRHGSPGMMTIFRKNVFNRKASSSMCWQTLTERGSGIIVVSMIQALPLAILSTLGRKMSCMNLCCRTVSE